MKKTKALCSGCIYDFYNDHNPLGIDECWSFASAKVVKRMQVGTWQNPPYVWQPIETLSCYRAEGNSFLERSDCRVVMPKREKVKP